MAYNNQKLVAELVTAGVPAVGVNLPGGDGTIALGPPFATTTGQWVILNAETTPASSEWRGEGAVPPGPPGSMLTDAENVIAAHDDTPPPPTEAEILAQLVDLGGLINTLALIVDKGDIQALEVEAGVTTTDTGRDDTVSQAMTQDEDDYNPGGFITVAPILVRLDPGGADREITGFVAPSPADHARVITMANIGAETITLLNEDAGSLAVNRILGPKQGPPGPVTYDVTVPPGGLRTLVYDKISNRWRVS